ncbi:response regulator [Herpetosiphon sp. NSE202]|uniref:response regulator n=1 Tax=Herpetosiphon sp. NSE202 TaxID=3351349 RepID=UPI003628C9AB
MAQTILVIDDEAKLRELLRSYLQNEGFNVFEAKNGREGLYVAREVKPDLILLDIMMPELGGLDFMRAWYKEAETPIILLTAKIEDHDKIIGLELGADDYITKPFNAREVMARVRAVLRRSYKAPTQADMLRIGEIVLERSACTLLVGEQIIDLTPSEFEILATLMAAPGHVFSRLDLLDRTSGQAYEGYERTIDVHIRNLRSKIEPDPKNPRYIETVYGVGYRFARAKRPE